MQPTREVVRPDNQLQLSEMALNEEIAKMLTANNPEAPKNIARFNMKERTYKFEPMVEQTIVHYATDGWMLHKGSEEAKKQTDLEKMENEASQRFQAEVDKAQHDRARGADGDDDDAPDDSKQLRNQFNFSERAAQTLNYPLRDRETFTEPPPTATVSGDYRGPVIKFCPKIDYMSLCLILKFAYPIDMECRDVQPMADIR